MPYRRTFLKKKASVRNWVLVEIVQEHADMVVVVELAEHLDKGRTRFRGARLDKGVQPPL